MNLLAFYGLSILENKPTPNIHFQMNLKNLGVDFNDQLLITFNINLHEANMLQYARFTRSPRGLKTKPT
jgi:hypothetical protein